LFALSLSLSLSLTHTFRPRLSSLYIAATAIAGTSGGTTTGGASRGNHELSIPRHGQPRYTEARALPPHFGGRAELSSPSSSATSPDIDVLVRHTTGEQADFATAVFVGGLLSLQRGAVVCGGLSTNVRDWRRLPLVVDTFSRFARQSVRKMRKSIFCGSCLLHFSCTRVDSGCRVGTCASYNRVFVALEANPRCCWWLR